MSSPVWIGWCPPWNNLGILFFYLSFSGWYAEQCDKKFAAIDVSKSGAVTVGTHSHPIISVLLR